KARAMAARGQGRERLGTEMPEPAAAEHDLWSDLRPLLDEELSRLPDRYRSAILLCDLGDRTRKEAAQQFGVPEGTLSGWLSRGRAMLARRLSRRGVTFAGGALATLLAQKAASASVPAAVLTKMVQTS